MSKQPSTMVHAHRFSDSAELTEALAQRLERVLTAPGSPGSGPPPHAIMLAGGSTPLPAYRALARRGVRPAPGIVLLYSDDRYVPSDSEASNYHQTLPLIEALALPAAQVLRVRTELPLEEAASDYERRLSELAQRGVRVGLGLLGLGADGHTASLFSAEDLARARGRSAIAVHRPDGRDAVSVTPDVLAGVEQILFVVTGEEKRAALAALLARSRELVAWRAVSKCRSVEVWTEPQAWPEGSARS